MTDSQNPEQAFVLRIAPSGIDRMPEALKSNQIIIGWSESEGLLKRSLTWSQFREIIHEAHYSDRADYRKSGAAAGHMWRFVRQMQIGDVVVVPYGSEFYVAEIKGDATYDRKKVEEDTAHRRNVKWLNSKKPIPREWAKSALISRMKIQGTSADATDLLPEIRECLVRAESGAAPTFFENLQQRLADETLKELQEGFMNEVAFERLIREVLLRLGAVEARIVPRNEDHGADIIANFRVAGAFSQTVAVQAKYWKPDPPVGKKVVKQLIQGIEAEKAVLGLVITTGTVAEDAEREAEGYFEETGIRIELLDGKQFAKLIVELGISPSVTRENKG
jgi:predicted Mrr-cat superfamily restriction endonuclease